LAKMNPNLQIIDSACGVFNLNLILFRGCETALYLQHLGKEVTIIEQTDRLCADANFAIEPAIQTRMEKGIRCLTDAKCTSISDQGANITYKDGFTEVITADSVILAVGMQSDQKTYQDMLDCAIEVIPIGDYIQPGTIQQASRTAYYTAMDL
jgi:hypothetical protein